MAGKLDIFCHTFDSIGWFNSRWGYFFRIQPSPTSSNYPLTINSLQPSSAYSRPTGISLSRAKMMGEMMGEKKAK